MRSNAELVECIRAEAHKKGTSLTKLELAVGLTNGRIGKWAKQAKFPPYDALVSIANLLGVSIYYLTGEKIPPPMDRDGLAPQERSSERFTSAEISLIRAYRLASSDDKTIVDAALKKYGFRETFALHAEQAV